MKCSEVPLLRIGHALFQFKIYLLRPMNKTYFQHLSDNPRNSWINFRKTFSYWRNLWSSDLLSPGIHHEDSFHCQQSFVCGFMKAHGELSLWKCFRLLVFPKLFWHSCLVVGVDLLLFPRRNIVIKLRYLTWCYFQFFDRLGNRNTCLHI